MREPPHIVYLGARALGGGVWGLSYGYAPGRHVEVLLQDHAPTESVVSATADQVRRLAETLANVL